MKIFVVNVRNCLTLSQYEPFFYEHIHKGNLILLDEIEDTGDLKITREQLHAYINQHPRQLKEAVVFLFIPRDFAAPLSPRDYELYNDMNTYMQLIRYLPEYFRCYTFYLDKTDELERNDAVYRELDMVNSSLRTEDPLQEDYFLRLPQLPAEGGDFKAFIRNVTKDMGPGARNFYEYMLGRVADAEGDSILFRNALNNYIGETRRTLDAVKHVHTQAYRDDVAKDIRAKLEIVYYLKMLATEEVTLATLPRFEDFHLSEYQYTQIKHTIATYCKRLQNWYQESAPAPAQSKCPTWLFQMKANPGTFRKQIQALIDGELAQLGTYGGSQNLVDAVFAKLSDIVKRAQELLDAFGLEHGKALLEPKNYMELDPVPFSLADTNNSEEAAEEAKLLERTNSNPGAESSMPGFAAENRLEQELELINNQLGELLDKLRAYKFSAFLITLLVSVLFVGALYFGAQVSVFIKENTLWIFLMYMLVTGGAFMLGYLICKGRYNKEISGLLEECKTKVKNYLENFQLVADKFVENVQAAGEYSCMKRMLDFKRAAREQYRLDMQKYAWHKEKVKQILKNLSFFDSFLQGAGPVEENPVTLDNFDHDPAHTEFYQMKVF